MPGPSCVQCRSPIPADAPQGVCPGCLLHLALTGVAAADDDAPGPRPARWVFTAAHEPAPPVDAGTAELGPESTAELGPSDGGSVAGLANYDLLGEIGSGGMGVVYKARQRAADRIVALKMIRGAGALDRHTRERFRTEAKALARLQHPNIVQVYDVGEDSGSPYFSLEYVEGGSLARKLKAGGPLDPTAAAELVRVLAEAVAAAHRAGVLHRDIKPANVLLTADGRPKVTDFGLARWLDTDEGLTGTGAMLGTPSYMAPEQAAGRNDEVGPHTDVYALGATLYEMLTGRPPFRADTALATASLVVNAEPSRPRAIRPDVPPELEAICLKCLEKQPARRYESAELLAADLGRWLRGDSTVARPLKRRQRAWRALKRRRWWVAAMVGVLLLTGATYAAAVYFTPKPEPMYVQPDPPEPTPPPPPPDPDAVVKEYTKQLAAGKPVTLIGATGEPKWHRWRYGKAGLGLSTDQRDVCQVDTRQTSVLELLPDPGCDRYRVSAEFFIQESTPGRIESEIFVGYQEFGSDEATKVQRFFQAGAEMEHHRETDVRGKKFARLGHRVILPNADIPHSLAPQRPLRAQVVELWRRVEVDVTPEEIVARIGEDGGEPGRYAAIATAKLPTALRDGQSEIDERLPGSGIRLADWKPRAPLGIVISTATVAVRNVVVIPLGPNKA